ncbi:MAG: outer membrane protein [Methyloceanibacter sp.]|uniref:outer membrane protein n=1 Tax=Methyloceanibacter sp. TaxID=1965321 RepID=UPI003D6D77E2
MRTRLHQAVVVTAVLTAGATASIPASSADLYASPPPYEVTPVPPQDVFEGWWLGGTIGGASVSYDFTPASGSISTDGIVGGVVGGYSWQHGPFVLGVEGDFLASDVSGSRRFNAGLNEASPSIDTMADIRLRAGYTITPRVLLFGTFGGAWADADLPISGPGGGIRETTFFGWSAGAGAEVALSPNWGARFDYQFTDFDSETVTYPGGKTTYDPDANTFRGSLTYRF